MPAESGLCDVDMMSEPFRSCVIGDYPNPDECLESDEGRRRASCQRGRRFHREFAFVRGPINMVFLAYKSDIIGVLPKLDFSLSEDREEVRLHPRSRQGAWPFPADHRHEIRAQ
jgi:hypothetical protein